MPSLSHYIRRLPSDYTSPQSLTYKSKASDWCTRQSNRFHYHIRASCMESLLMCDTSQQELSVTCKYGFKNTSMFPCQLVCDLTGNPGKANQTCSCPENIQQSLIFYSVVAYKSCLESNFTYCHHHTHNSVNPIIKNPSKLGYSFFLTDFFFTFC